MAGKARKCRASEILCAPHGSRKPVSVHVETFGTEYQSTDFIEQFVKENYDLTPKGIIGNLKLLDVDYNRVSSYGQFGKTRFPWEK